MSRLDLALTKGDRIYVLAAHPGGISFVQALLAYTDLAVQIELILADTLTKPTIADPRCSIGFATADTHDAVRDGAAGVGKALGLVCGWPKRVPKAVIDAFDGLLLNVHSGDLPRYRGAGGGSWQVLNDEKGLCADIQQMRPELDQGPILLRERREFDAEPLYPIHVKQCASLAIEALVGKLAKAIATGQQFELHEQDEQRALYFPRLDTMQNGWIDFDWSVHEIERFVRAFSTPYPGAAFYCGKQGFRVRRSWVRSREPLHPYCNGLVVHSQPGFIDVAAHDGIIRLEDLTDLAGSATAVSLQPGARCWNRASRLLQAKRFRPDTGFSRR